MNKLSILITLIFLETALATQTDEGTNGDINNKTLFSYICNDEKLIDIENKLKVLVDANKNLTLILNLIVDENRNLRNNLDTFTSSINLQLTKLETTITNLTTAPRQSESTISNSTFTSDQMMDILRNISDSKSFQKSDMKCNMSQPTNCAEAFEQNANKSGIYEICLPESKLEPFFVYCLADAEQHEAPWTIIQRRQNGSVDFYRNWTDYQRGFGNLQGEFFIGLDLLHALTQSTPHELWIQVKDFTNAKGSAHYSSFLIGNISEAYALKTLGSFRGDIADGLKYHVGQKFTTKDVDNDLHSANCAEMFTGAWWYKSCYHSNLNGKYLGDKRDNKGIIWFYWHERNDSLKYVHMAIRPVCKNKKCCNQPNFSSACVN